MSNVPRPNIVWRGASPSNFTYGRPGASRDGRNTFHHVVGTAESAALVFNNPSRGASAHFIVTDQPGLIFQCVDVNDTSWSDGNWESNLRTISVEHHGDWRNGYDNPVVRENAALLAAWLRDQGLVDHPIRHRQVTLTGTECPADLPVEAIWDRASEIIASYNSPQDARPQWLKDRQLTQGTVYAQKDGLFLYDLNDVSRPADERRFALNQSFTIGSTTVIDGLTYYITKSSTDTNAPYGLKENEVAPTPYVAPTQPTPQPITPDWADSLLVNEENRTMYVLRPTPLVDLENGRPVIRDGKEIWYNTGDKVENISAHTIVSSVTYQLTEYSFQQTTEGNFDNANGIKSSDLSVDAASVPASTGTPVVTNDNNYTVKYSNGTVIGKYPLLAVAYTVLTDAQLKAPLGSIAKILTRDGTDITSDVMAAYRSVPTTPPAVPATPTELPFKLRLPAVDSATFKAIITWAQVNIPVVLVWLADPQSIHFVNQYVPWLLPLVTWGAGAAAFVIGLARKDVKNY